VTAMSEQGAVGPTAGTAGEWWHPTAGAAQALVWLLAAQAAGQLILIPYDSGEPYVRIHRAFDELLKGHDNTAQTLINHAFDGSHRGLIQIVNVIGFAVLVLFAIWGWRSATNARALGRAGARLGPVWAVVGWLIPVAWLVLPYIVIQDLWRSSAPAAARGSRWRRLPGSNLVRGWWAVHVAGSLLGGAALVWALTGGLDADGTGTVLRAGHAVAAAGALLAILVVREVTERQSAQQEADPAPTSRPATDRRAVTAGGGPGWYDDPGRRFDHRYWDGSAWTEHVSTDGRPSIAPSTPPDWYPDPTGRFHWRYWTGDAWTEHVSRDQELFIDPVSPGDAEPS
jgi:Domain of unknown function (DUF4328)/Protein of unknown function (DUF2510)